MSANLDIKSDWGMTLRQAACMAGLGYLSIFVVSSFANTMAIEVILDRDQIPRTLENVAAKESLFRLGIAGWMVVLVSDVVVALGLCVLFAPVNRAISLMAAWFRIIFVLIFAGAFIDLYALLEVSEAASTRSANDIASVHEQATAIIRQYDFASHIGLLFFGFTIFLLGYLMLKSSYAPRIIGLLLVVAAGGYFVDGFGNIVSAGYASDPRMFIIFVAIPAVFAEFSFTIWLLITGFRKPTTAKIESHNPT